MFAELVLLFVMSVAKDNDNTYDEEEEESQPNTETDVRVVASVILAKPLVIPSPLLRVEPLSSGKCSVAPV